MLAKALQGSTAAAPTYVDDVFSTYLYTGNGSTQTITNGINLAGLGGLVWIKCRSLNYRNHLFDTARGANIRLRSDGTEAQGSGTTWLTSFNSNGFSLGSNSDVNLSTETYTSWTFRKAPKFFDVVTYTGTGVNRTIPHSLGQVPGMIIVKCTSTATNWQVYHRGLANTEYMQLNTSDVKTTGATRWNSTTPTATEFSLGTDSTVNASGSTYVAYLFAHDTAADGLIQCGSYSGTGAAQNITLGWEPQFVIIKRASGGTGDWNMVDSMRGFVVGGGDAWLRANTSAAESSADLFDPTATGFNMTAISAEFNASGSTYIYIAIRRPNKPPTSGTQVYNGIARTGTGTTATVNVGFAVDASIICNRNSGAISKSVVGDRLRGGGKSLITSSTSSELNEGAYDYYNTTVTLSSDGIYNFINGSGNDYINWFFRRAPGFFDQVCHTGTGANLTLAHNLTVIPELVITKKRSATNEWYVTHSFTGTGYKRQFLEQTAAATDHLYSANFIYTAQPTTSSLFFTGNANVNQSTDTFIHYLFASLPGISKVGSYTGNGSNQTINCGFSAGARFVLIKRTDSTGDWYVWDTARGIVSGNDPHLSLNSTAAEVTTNDSIDPDNSGFVVNQLAATNINVSSATYIFLAIA